MIDGQWLVDVAAKARARLEATPVEHLGPAARILLGYRDATCPACHGRGIVRERQTSCEAAGCYDVWTTHRTNPSTSRELRFCDRHVALHDQGHAFWVNPCE